MTATAFNKVEAELLNVIQSDFPLVATPYASIGDRLGISEAQVLECLTDLKNKNIIRQISAIFDTRKLGYKSSLVAMRFEEEDLDVQAQVVNEHPGVSHNYGRTGLYNLWFTIAVPPGASLDDDVEILAKKTNALSWRMLPTRRFFKIGVNFDMVNKKSDASDNFVAEKGVSIPSPSGNHSNSNTPISDEDKAFVREFQVDLELTSRPFDGMADRLGIAVSDVFDIAAQMQEKKLMRRYSAVLYHRRAGFSANAMVVWKVPEERGAEVGEIMAESSHVTHCYERPTYDDWPYSHYTMIHATTPDECEAIVEQISAATQITDKQLIYSTREYKKTRVQYFV